MGSCIASPNRITVSRLDRVGRPHRPQTGYPLRLGARCVHTLHPTPDSARAEIKSRYTPGDAINSSWVPVCSTLPSRSTTSLSADKIVDNRWATMRVVRFGDRPVGPGLRVPRGVVTSAQSVGSAIRGFIRPLSATVAMSASADQDEILDSAGILPAVLLM